MATYNELQRGIRPAIAKCKYLGCSNIRCCHRGKETKGARGPVQRTVPSTPQLHGQENKSWSQEDV